MSFQLFLQHIRSGERQEELGEKTTGTESVSSAVCDNHIARLEAGWELVAILPLKNSFAESVFICK